MRSAIFSGLTMLLIVLLGPLAIAAVLLAAGSLLAHFFAVSVWEATVVVAERVVVVGPDLPWRPAGRRRRRRRS